MTMREIPTYVDRQNTDCRKWDGMADMFSTTDMLPLWVADMDFKAPHAVCAAIERAAQFGVFGYYHVPNEYFDAFIDWEARRHGVQIKREHICHSPGTLTGTNWLIECLTEPGDAVALLTPVYFPFLRSVKDRGRTLITCDLIEKDGCFTIDFDAFEQKIKENGVKMFIHITPHNPIGRVWTAEETQKLCQICKAHGVIMLSDEMHQDLIMPGHKHVPTMSVAGDLPVITMTSGSKTFSIAAFRNSYFVIPDEKMREKYLAYCKSVPIAAGNALGYIATAAAFRSGEGWLAEMLKIIEENYNVLCRTLKKDLPKVVISPLEGTYLVWLDLGAYVKPEDFERTLEYDCKIAVDYGEWFGGERYATWLRLNLATSGENIAKAAQRIVNALSK